MPAGLSYRPFPSTYLLVLALFLPKWGAVGDLGWGKKSCSDRVTALRTSWGGRCGGPGPESLRNYTRLKGHQSEPRGGFTSAGRPARLSPARPQASVTGTSAPAACGGAAAGGGRERPEPIGPRRTSGPATPGLQHPPRCCPQRPAGRAGAAGSSRPAARRPQVGGRAAGQPRGRRPGGTGWAAEAEAVRSTRGQRCPLLPRAACQSLGKPVLCGGRGGGAGGVGMWTPPGGRPGSHRRVCNLQAAGAFQGIRAESSPL